MAELAIAIKNLFGNETPLVLVLIIILGLAIAFFFWFIKEQRKTHADGIKRITDAHTDEIKRITNAHIKEIEGKRNARIQLQNKFLEHQEKIIEVLNRFDSSITISQDNDLKGQQIIKELREEIQRAGRTIELKFEKVLLRLKDN